MGFVKNLLVGGSVAALLAGAPAVEDGFMGVYASENGSVRERIRSLERSDSGSLSVGELYDLSGLYEQVGEDTSAEEFFVEAVKREARSGSVDDILEPAVEDGLIEESVYDSSDGRTKGVHPNMEEDFLEGSTDLEELVYQRDVPVEDCDPVLLFKASDYNLEEGDASVYSSVLFKRLAREFGDELDFVYHNIPSADRITWQEGAVRTNESWGEGLRENPSFALYAPFDVVEEKPPYEGDSIKQVDILAGGLGEPEYALEWRDYLKEWVGSNITDTEGYDKAIRCNNSLDCEKVDYEN